MSDDDIDDDYEDEEFEPTPPTPRRVAERALVLAAVAARGILEMQSQNGFDEAHEHQPRIAEWVRTLGLVDECEPEEWERIGTPVGELSPQEMIDSIWRLESLGVLAWALHRYDLPRYDTLVDTDQLLPAACFLDLEGAQELLADPDVRDEEELNGLGNQILAFHWRVRDYSINPQPLDFRAFGENCWFGPISTDWAVIVEDDLALDDVPISKADDDARSRAMSTARERHVAINWLRGWSELFSETDTST